MGYVDMVRLLVEKGGASMTLKNNKGKTPLQLAEEGKNHEVAALLRRLEEKKRGKKTALAYSARGG